MAVQRRNPYTTATMGMEDGMLDENLNPQPIAPGGPDPNSPTPPQGPIVPSAPPAPTGGYDYEKVRKGWAYGGGGFGTQTSLADLQKFLADNTAFTQGVTMRGEKLYDPSGRFMFDAIGNFTGGDPSQMTRIALEGNSKPKLKKPKGGPTTVDSGDGGIGLGQSIIGGGNKGNPRVIGKPKGGGPTTPPPTLPPGGPEPRPEGGNLDMNAMLKQLEGLFAGGGFNQGVVDSRVSSATDALNRGRKSRMASNQAALAERGLLDSGAETSTINRMDDSLYDTYSGAVRDIYSNESENADSRMMQALTTAAGLTSEQARQVIDRFRAVNEDKYNMGNLRLGGERLGLDRELGRGNLALGNRNASINEMLGRGNLALGNLNAQNNYNLGIGNLGLGRDELLLRARQGDTNALIDLLKTYMSGAQSTTGGYR